MREALSLRFAVISQNQQQQQQNKKKQWQRRYCNFPSHYTKVERAVANCKKRKANTQQKRKNKPFTAKLYKPGYRNMIRYQKKKSSNLVVAVVGEETQDADS